MSTTERLFSKPRTNYDVASERADVLYDDIDHLAEIVFMKNNGLWDVRSYRQKSRGDVGECTDNPSEVVQRYRETLGRAGLDLWFQADRELKNSPTNASNLRVTVEPGVLGNEYTLTTYNKRYHAPTVEKVPFDGNEYEVLLNLLLEGKVDEFEAIANKPEEDRGTLTLPDIPHEDIRAQYVVRPGLDRSEVCTVTFDPNCKDEHLARHAWVLGDDPERLLETIRSRDALPALTRNQDMICQHLGVRALIDRDLSMILPYLSERT